MFQSGLFRSQTRQGKTYVRWAAAHVKPCAARVPFPHRREWVLVEERAAISRHTDEHGVVERPLQDGRVSRVEWGCQSELMREENKADCGACFEVACARESANLISSEETETYQIRSANESPGRIPPNLRQLRDRPRREQSKYQVSAPAVRKVLHTEIYILRVVLAQSRSAAACRPASCLTRAR
jgi:hypothetical protein